MKARVLLFATLRERFGRSEMVMELSRGTKALEILKILCGDADEAKKMSRSILFAINEEYVPAQTEIQEGDEVALIPPVAGG